jgi:hypothetical protein
MSKSFLITSHTEGAHPFEQRTILNGLVKSLKHYFPDCFIVVASQSQVEVDTQQIVDYVVIDQTTVNQPYGAGEIALLNAGLDVMIRFGKTDCYKMVYDFVIDDRNYQVFDQWLTHGKDFVGCYWHSDGLGIGSWIWYGSVKMQKKILDFNNLNMHLECKLLESVRVKNLIDSCYLYDNNESMFNGDWFDRCDLVHAGGAVLKHKYGTVAAALELTDDTEYYIPMIIGQIADQTKRPNHLVLIDRRTVKEDLRTKEVYQCMFEVLRDRQISWNLIFYTSPKHTIDHLADLGQTWCWLIDNQTYLDKDVLKQLYRTIIVNYNVGTISGISNTLFYRNRILNFEGLNIDSRQFIVDKMTETCYSNITV